MSEGASVSELNIPLLRKMVEWVEEQEQLLGGWWDCGGGRKLVRCPQLGG